MPNREAARAVTSLTSADIDAPAWSIRTISSRSAPCYRPGSRPQPRQHPPDDGVRGERTEQATVRAARRIVALEPQPPVRLHPREPLHRQRTFGQLHDDDVANR